MLMSYLFLTTLEKMFLWETFREFNRRIYEFGAYFNSITFDDITKDENNNEQQYS